MQGFTVQDKVTSKSVEVSSVLAWNNGLFTDEVFKEALITGLEAMATNNW